MAKLTKNLPFKSFKLSCNYVMFHIWYFFCIFIWMYISEMFFYEWVAIKYNTCQQSPPLDLMATTPNHSPPLTSREKGEPRYSLSKIRIPLFILPLSTCWNLWMSSPFVYATVYQFVRATCWKLCFCWIVLFMLPLTVGKICKRCSSRRTKTYTS